MDGLNLRSWMPRGVASGIVCAVLLAAAGCASSPDSDAPRGPSDLITPEEVAYYQDQSVRGVYEMLERARPRWLRSVMGSPSVSSGYPVTVVFLDNHMLEDIENLRDIPLTNVRRAEWLSASEADQLSQAASMNLRGAIVVHTLPDRDR